MISFPNAKINIGLNVVAKRSDGYHDIETVFYPVNVQDVLEVNARKIIKSGRPIFHRMAEPESFFEDENCSLTIKGNLLPGNPADNLVIKAYRMLLEDFDLPPVDIMLYKHIPSGAGLGGGSSDCANIIKLLNRRFGLRMTDRCMERYASRLGADCAFFIRNIPVIACGTGDVMKPVGLSLKGYTIVMVKPALEVSTREAYSMVTPAKPEKSLEKLIELPVSQWRGQIVNDFEKSIFSQYPEIATLKDRLYEAGAVYSSMSGSGSTVYGIFETALSEPESMFPDCTVHQRVLS